MNSESTPAIEDAAAAIADDVVVSADRREHAIEFVMCVGLALHNAGAPAHRLEDVMVKLSETLDLDGAFFSQPTALQVTFNGNPPRTILMRTQPGNINLSKLVAIDLVAQAAADGKMTPLDGVRELTSLENAAQVAAQSRASFVTATVAGGIVGGAAARVLGGGYADVFCAVILGVMVLLIGRHFSQSARVEKVGDLVTTLCCVFGAHLLSQVFEVRVDVIALAGLIMLIPGFTLTVALTELATGHLVSGTARLLAAGIVFLQIAVGYAAGSRLALALFDPAPVSTAVAPAWTEFVAVLVAGLGVTMLMRARTQATGWIVLATALAVYSARVATPLFGAELAAGVGALSAGLFANAYARIKKHPATEILSPAIILLVPGAIGFASLRSLIHSDVLAGVQGAFSMAMVGAAIVVGVLSANAIVPPRRLL